MCLYVCVGQILHLQLEWYVYILQAVSLLLHCISHPHAECCLLYWSHFCRSVPAVLLSRVAPNLDFCFDIACIRHTVLRLLFGSKAETQPATWNWKYGCCDKTAIWFIERLICASSCRREVRLSSLLLRHQVALMVSEQEYGSLVEW